MLQAVGTESPLLHISLLLDFHKRFQDELVRKSGTACITYVKSLYVGNIIYLQ
jgi:hypothetical protein